MTFADWVRRTTTRIRENPSDGLRDSTYELYAGAWRHLGWHVPRGVNVYDREWDVLIVLDACRVDLLREVADEYAFVSGVESVGSVGSMSEEWMVKTFTTEYAAETRETAYVTGNAFSAEVLDAADFQVLDEVWHYGWDDELGTVPPDPVTDRAIAVGREYAPDFLIVHYMQPHHPFVGTEGVDSFAADPFGRDGGETVVDALRKGKIDRETFWSAYRDTLRTVLDQVELLLRNLDADTVAITADHGDAIGEWGIYDHPAGCLHPVVKNVPWVKTSATDLGEYDPSITPQSSSASSENVEARLQQLGYL
ncbi:hypothetical protein [Halococcus saccharolyticus]|uniref:Sulfatase n=1 Tax=Halococcus saccharolyticus DSM 5350 TaxID=1227455 RepID=M0MGH8_9EURY|nr:hypothetical protein [Halococcus saccharolyticus]EMA44816.1 hypothetical protein C449_09164 [Halococcus saccharolyticus DSM 5350]